MLIGPAYVFADKTLVPLPIFTTDPNEGETYGALLAIIDAQAGAFRSLLVPTLTYNSLLGAAGSVHYERYFDHDTKFDTDLAQSTRNQAFYRLRYAKPTLFDGRYIFQGFGLYENDRTAHFTASARTAWNRTRPTIPCVRAGAS